jgi:WD40 repeat protein
VRRLAATVLGVAFLVGTIGAEHSSPSRSAGSKPNSSLVFEGIAGVYALGADGRGLRLVARDAWAPQWSADGKSIAFFRDSRPYHLDLSTGRTRPFPPVEADDFALSPDGARIAFSDDTTGGFAIFVANLNGRGAKRLTSGPDDFNPAWSSDGKSIMFRRGFHPGRIAIVNVDSAIVKELAKRGERPQWSPNGRYIAYTVPVGDDGLQSYVAVADGSRRWPVTPVTKDSLCLPIAWSPRSDRLAVTGTFGKQQGVFVTGVKGSGWRMVASSRVNDDCFSPPAWSSDAALLAFITAGNIWLARPDGFGKRVLFDAVRWGYEANSPTWDPLGRPVASLRWRRVSPAIPPMATAHGNRLDAQAAVIGVAADGPRLALLLLSDGLRHVEVWDPSRRRIVAYPDDSGEGHLAQVGLAGERVLWRGYDEGNHVYPFVVTAHSSRRTPVAAATQVDWNRGEHLLGQGSLLVFDTWTVDRQGRIHDRRLWRMVGDRAVQIPAGVNVGRPLAVDAGRIAVLRDPHTLALIDSRGKLLRSFSFPELTSPGARLSGNRLALLGRDALVIYDTNTGAQVRQTSLASRKRLLAGLGGGMVAYLDNHVLHLLRIGDGHDTTLGRYDLAVLNASGLFTIRLGQVTFKPLATVSNRP